MQIRILHACIGMLIAPSVLFFAATGLLQIYSLHEAHSGYTPPALIESLSAIHKDQRFGHGHAEPADAGHHHADGPEEGAPHDAVASRGGKPRGARIATTLLKAFFAFVATGLILSTLAGTWMALQQRLRRRTHLALLLIGAAVPAMLAFMTVQ
jgi:hypothetical protein